VVDPTGDPTVARVANRPPFPVGWFVVADLNEVPEGALVPLAVFGQDLAVGRTPAGRALVTHSVCPHLGADLAAGGRIDDDRVVCPLHEWCFSHGGACTSAADGPIPETVVLRVWPTEVVDGIVWAFNGRDGEVPASPPPALPLVTGPMSDADRSHRPGHPEDVLAGILASAGVTDGSPADGDPDTWAGTAPDGLRVRVHGPGTLVVWPPDGTPIVVHVTPVDGFGLKVRTSDAVPPSGTDGVPGSLGNGSFGHWYRRFDRSSSAARRPVRSGRGARRRALADGVGETPPD